MLEGGGVKEYTKAKALFYSDPKLFELLLEKIEKQGQLDRVKLIYCTSYFQNPTGLSLSIERRPRLLEIAKKKGTLSSAYVKEESGKAAKNK